jgi:N-acetylmuramate 1-kinase
MSDLEEWLARLGYSARTIEPLTGDVSPRRYFRVLTGNGGEAILATYPEEVRGTCQRFLRTTALLEGAGVRVPRILASACDRGWMLVEDLGSRTLADYRDLPWSELARWFEQALSWLQRIASLSAAEVAALNPALDGELMRRELQQTWDLFLAPRGLTGGPTLTAALRAALDAVCERLAAGPPAPCHRDYMSRNLIPVDEPAGLAVLDHQDLRLGPPEYDLASLLNDTLFPPPEIEEALLTASGADRTRYHRAAAQRTLKAVGTYTSFSLRGADRHLPLIAPTLSRCLDHLSRIPEGAPLVEELGQVWAPVVEPAVF